MLDVGSGGGDTALLAEEVVGGEGEVVGVDQSPAFRAIATARRRVSWSFSRLSRATLIDQPGACPLGGYSSGCGSGSVSDDYNLVRIR